MKKKYNVDPYQQDNYFKAGLSVVLLLLAVLTFIKYFYIHLHDLTELLRKFTYQSNILVLVVMILFFTPIRKKKFFSYLMFMACIDILFTTIIVHTILDPKEKYALWKCIKLFELPDNVHFCHTIIPILFGIFYFVNNIEKINTKKSYIGVLHPLIYYCSYLLINLVKKINYYPYDFINPQKPSLFSKGFGEQGYLSVFSIVLLLSFSFYIFSYIVLCLKNKLMTLLK